MLLSPVHLIITGKACLGQGSTRRKTQKSICSFSPWFSAFSASFEILKYIQNVDMNLKRWKCQCTSHSILISHTWSRFGSMSLVWEASWTSFAVSWLRHDPIVPNKCPLDKALKKHLKWWLKLTDLTPLFSKKCKNLFLSVYQLLDISIFHAAHFQAANKDKCMLSFEKLISFQHFAIGCQTVANRSLRFKF